MFFPLLFFFPVFSQSLKCTQTPCELLYLLEMHAMKKKKRREYFEYVVYKTHCKYIHEKYFTKAQKKSRNEIHSFFRFIHFICFCFHSCFYKYPKMFVEKISHKRNVQHTNGMDGQHRYRDTYNVFIYFCGRFFLSLSLINNMNMHMP